MLRGGQLLLGNQKVALLLKLYMVYAGNQRTV